MSLLSIGTVAFDSIESPYGKVDRIIGGSCPYISLAASFFYQPIQVVAVIGEDFPKEYLNKLSDKGIDLKGLQLKLGEKSFYWSGKYHKNLNSRDTLVTELNVLENFTPIIPDEYQSCDFLMLGNLSPQVQLQAIKNLKIRPKFIVMDTMNFWMDIAMEELKVVMKEVDLISINDEEAEQLTGEQSIRKAAKKILTMGPRYLIIKKGEHGALLFYGEEMFYCPALPLEEVFDPTGAGDTFAGGFIGYLANSGDISFENMKKAVVHGSALASFCVEKFGTDRLFEISENELEDRVAQFRRLSQF